MEQILKGSENICRKMTKKVRVLFFQDDVIRIPLKLQELQFRRCYLRFLVISFGKVVLPRPSVNAACFDKGSILVEELFMIDP